MPTTAPNHPDNYRRWFQLADLLTDAQLDELHNLQRLWRPATHPAGKDAALLAMARDQIDETLTAMVTLR